MKVDSLQSVTQINVPTITKDMPISTSELFDSVFAVKLETSDNSIIGEISCVKVKNDTIYVLDRYSMRCLRRFRMDGTYIDDIGKNGTGPGEYLEPTSFSLTNKGILLYDQSLHLNILYDYQGNYIETNRAPFGFMYGVALSDSLSIYYLTNNRNYHLPPIHEHTLWTANTEGKALQCGLRRGDGIMKSYCSLRPFYEINDTLCIFTDSYNDTLYYINSKGIITPSFKLEFDSPRDNAIWRVDNELSPYKDLSPKGEYTIVNECLQCGDYIYVDMTSYRKGYHLFYSTKTHNTKVCTRLEHDESNCAYDLIKMRGVYNDFIVGEMPAFYILSRYNFNGTNYWQEWDKEFNSNKGKEFTEFCKNLSPEDNHVLVFFHMKKW
ncbi:MAG: 6-bladed beta-propeller [Bacteroidales bacterium]|nr:6-bladed beta-propeller [Bacteroidales bacterium]